MLTYRLCSNKEMKMFLNQQHDRTQRKQSWFEKKDDSPVMGVYFNPNESLSQTNAGDRAVD